MNLIILLFSISYIAPLILSALSIKIRSLFLSITSIFSIFSLLLSFVEKIYGVLIAFLAIIYGMYLKIYGILIKLLDDFDIFKYIP